MAFSPGGKLLASEPYDKTVRLWNPASEASLRVLEDHSFWVTAGAFSPDDKHLAFGSNDKTDRFWDEGNCGRGARNRIYAQPSIIF